MDQFFTDKHIILKKILPVIFASLVLLLLCGCGDSSTAEKTSEDDMKNGGKNMPDYIEITDNKEFMKEKYGLSDEELEGIDVDRLVSDFGFRNTDYTPDEVREILKEFGPTYTVNEADKIFSLLDMEGGTIGADDDITYIGFLENSGTLVTRMVFDIKGKVYYYDDAEPKALTDDQLAILAGLAEDYGIYNWDQHYLEEDLNESTANYSWKLVFYTADGTVASYDGYSPEGKCLPENYKEVKNKLRDIALDK